MTHLRKMDANKFNLAASSMVYTALMLVCYFAYLLLDHYRIGQAQKWAAKSSLTQQDIQFIDQAGRWTSMAEMLVILIFVIGTIFSYYFFSDKKKVLSGFLILNVSLFVFVLVAGFLLFSETLPIGNIAQPMFFPSLILLLLLIHLIFMRKKL